MQPAIEGDLRLGGGLRIAVAGTTVECGRQATARVVQSPGMPIGNAGYFLGQYGFSARRGKTFCA